jgi:hypothetical protein
VRWESNEESQRYQTREYETVIIFFRSRECFVSLLCVGFSSLHASYVSYLRDSVSQHKHSGAFSLLHVRLAVLEQALPDERLAEQKFNVFLCPALSWQSLQEHHDLLEVHLAQLVRPLDQESCAYVEVESREALIFRLLVDIVSKCSDSSTIGSLFHLQDKYPTSLLCS